MQKQNSRQVKKMKANKKKDEQLIDNNLAYEVFKFWRSLDYEPALNTWRKLGEVDKKD